MNRMFTATCITATCVAHALSHQPATSTTDWRAFRGTDASATSVQPAATTWSDDTNIAWKAALPGPGSSSPIIVGDAVFITCWSGYATDPENLGDIANLRRHLMRLDRTSGKIVWSVDIKPVPTEDTFDGRMSSHGYASSTPVSDGEHVFVMFGKSGVFAFDLDGTQLWHTSVGTGSSEWKTGSGSSLALCGDLLIANASDESHSVRALHTSTGEEAWRRETPKLDQAYGTPLVMKEDDGPVIVLGLLGEIWGMHPKTGELKWSITTRTGGALAPTVVGADDMIYSIGGQGRQRSYAARIGGSGDVTASHVIWISREGAYVPTPLLMSEHLVWADDGGIATCVATATGELAFKERLAGPCYASAVRAGDAIYLTTRREGVYVIAAQPEYALISHNQIASDDTDFDATPAISDGQLFLRSDKYLYCIAPMGD